jgi:apolipoprotein N-acyltransferase
MLVNVTNDGWFLQSDQTEVHLANARFRAIELRRPMCRATNTGVTCFIDTKGREVGRLSDPATGGTFIEGCLTGEVEVPSQPVITLYARFGDWFPATLLSIAALSALLTRLMRWRA